jgi:hypothetical protein
MAITIKPREKKPYTNEASYIRITGDLRDNLRLIAAWSGRTQQDVGEDMLRQACDEVLPKVPKSFQAPERNHGYTFTSRRRK